MALSAPTLMRATGLGAAVGELPEAHLEEVGEDVVAHQPGDPRFEGGGPDRQTTSQRDADETYLVNAVMVEHSGHRALPLHLEWQASLFEGTSLARPLEPDHLPPARVKPIHHREELLDVAVEPAEDHHRAPRSLDQEPVGRQPPITVGDAVAVPGRYRPAA